MSVADARTRFRCIALATFSLPLVPQAAIAQSPAADSWTQSAMRLAATVQAAFSREETAALSLVLGIIVFAVTVSIMLVRTRRRLEAREREADEALGELKARVERAEGLLAADQQVLAVWDHAGEGVDVRCDPGASRDLPRRTGDVLAFGKWLAPDSAGEIERLVERLRGSGESFNVMLKTRAGGYIEADGRVAAGRAVLRLRDLAGQRRDLAEIYHRHKQLLREVDCLRTLLGELPMPAWIRDADGRLAWVNPAYARAVGASDPAQAIESNAALVDDALRPAAATRPDGDDADYCRVPAVLSGERRVLDLFEAGARDGSAGLAIDVTEIEEARNELARREVAQARTLDSAATGIAVFGADRRLAFHNVAFRSVLGLDEAFLAGQPDYGEILDHLRAQGRLPEQADYRAWRRRQLAEFEAGDPEGAEQEHWHIPDGRILRVVRTSHPGGGMGCLYEDVSETLALESRLAGLTRVQRETLDSLEEGIAVFGSDGRLKLHNRGLVRMWRLAPAALDGAPHVEEVAGWCRALHDDAEVWQALRTAVTGLADSREAAAARFERSDGRIVDMHALPLPDGGTLAVFTDITDSARMEKALRDRNEALLAAARIKNEFVHKVSYELRAPLTNIIGFGQLVSDEATGPLNERQREYVGHILGSSGALLAIINDILDLATIDAGAMELEIGEVDAARAVQAAVEAIHDRTVERDVTMQIDVDEDVGSFQADEKRVRQILFNLLSNAVGFSEPGQTVRLTGRRDDGEVVFTVSDQGPGIPESVRRSVFGRFESHALGTRHSGVGLGLSIVKSFVELHGGTVQLESEPGCGTTLTCIFPLEPPPGTDEHELRGGATVARLAVEPSAGDAAGADSHAKQSEGT